jgi:flagellin
MISIQTNYASLVGQQNMNVNQMFQTKTIEALTSGYRINASGDDAAGLAVANGYRSNVAELTQGVINANSGVSQLQIMDGGLNNISNILDRLKTLATESSSSTFTGDRTTLNNEFQSLMSEINRQAANIGLNTGGTNLSKLTVYVGGGGSTQSNSQVSVDLSSSVVDTTGLGLSTSNLLGQGTDFSAGPDLRGHANILTTPGTETFTIYMAGQSTGITANVTSTTAAGLTIDQAIGQLNSTLSAHGITASIDQNSGKLMLSSSQAFTALESGSAGLVTGGASVADSQSMYRVDGLGTYGVLPNNEALTFTNAAGNTKTITLTAAADTGVGPAVTDINTQLQSLGIYAVKNSAGTGINFQSAQSFTLSKAAGAGTETGVLGTGASTPAVTGPNAVGTATGNSLAAVTAVQGAVAALGLTQGKIGAGENTLQYAVALAQSQMTNLNSAQSQLRDADVAQEAANLTKAQVLQQTSIAAMAQANSAPQAVLKLLQ